MTLSYSPFIHRLWEDMKGSFPVMKHPLCLCFQHLVLNKNGTEAGWAQARWINVCCDCHISCWGVLCPDRVKPAFEWQLLQSKETRWQMVSKPAFPQKQKAGSGFWNVYGRVITLLFYYFWETMTEFIRDEPRLWQARNKLPLRNTEKWQHNTHLKCVCVCVALATAQAHTHAHVRAHRWQRNLAEALICRLDAGF